ncbi:MAG: hypothetical protein E7323_04260 [Clostridiales bacterium]|nr:hypothetical protein [Clostridiales bacterium]
MACIGSLEGTLYSSGLQILHLICTGIQKSLFQINPIMIRKPHHLRNHISHLITKLCIHIWNFAGQCIVLFFDHHLFCQFTYLLAQFDHRALRSPRIQLDFGKAADHFPVHILHLRKRFAHFHTSCILYEKWQHTARNGMLPFFICYTDCQFYFRVGLRRNAGTPNSSFSMAAGCTGATGCSTGWATTGATGAAGAACAAGAGATGCCWGCTSCGMGCGVAG